MINGALLEKANSGTIDVSRRRGDDVRDERSNHPKAPVRDELEGIDPNDREDLHAQDSRHSHIIKPAQQEMSAGKPDGTALLEKREIEKGLRELGLSARQARRMVAGGYRCYSEGIDAEKADELLGELLSFYRALSRYAL